jgi:hypothetical protein
LLKVAIFYYFSSVADLEKRMREYAEAEGISVDELRRRLDAEMQQKSGPTFEEPVEKVCHIIDQPSTPPSNTLKYHRATDLLGIDTDLMTSKEAGDTYDKALDELGVRPEVLAVMEVAVKYDKPLKIKPRRKKGEVRDPMFGMFHRFRSEQ